MIALLGGDGAADGTFGAEFRVDGFDSSWFNAVTPNPVANVSIGNPITGGCNIAFPSCQVGPNVLLYTIQTVALVAIPPTTFTVRRHTNPSSPNWLCPHLRRCDVSFSKVCVTGGSAFVNGGSCSVGVAEATWSTVKNLYGN